MEDIVYINNLLEEKLGRKVNGKLNITNIQELDIRTYDEYAYSVQDRLKFIRRILEDGNYLFIIDRYIEPINYNNFIYPTYSKWVYGIEIVMTSFIEDIIDTDLTVKQCIIKNESNPEFNFNIEFRYDNNLFTSVFQACIKYKVNHCEFRKLLRNGYTPQEILDKLRSAVNKRTKFNISIKGFYTRKELLESLYSDEAELKELGKTLNVGRTHIISNIDRYIYEIEGVTFLGTQALSKKEGFINRMLRPALKEVLKEEDFDKRSKLMTEHIIYYRELLNYKNEKYRSFTSLKEALNISGGIPQQLFTERRPAKEIHEALDNVMEMREKYNKLFDLMEIRIGRVNSLNEVFEKLVTLTNHDIEKFKSLWMKANRDAETFNNMLDYSIELWDKNSIPGETRLVRNTDYSKVKSDLAKERGVTIGNISSYLNALKLEFRDFYSELDKYYYHAFGKKYLFPQELCNEFNLDPYLIADILREVREVNYEDRKLMLESKINYYRKLLTYGGIDHTSYKEILRYYDISSSTVKASYTRRDSPEEFHKVLEEAIERKRKILENRKLKSSSIF